MRRSRRAAMIPSKTQNNVSRSPSINRFVFDFRTVRRTLRALKQQHEKAMIAFINGLLSHLKNYEMINSDKITTALITGIVWTFLSAIDLIFGFPIYAWSLRKKRKKCPPIEDAVLLMPAVALAEAIRKQKITCESVVAAYIKRIKQVNVILNAIVQDRFELAKLEAKMVDRLVRSAEYGEDELRKKFPLLGVPITVKESIAVIGMSNNAGMKCSRGKATKNAEIVDLVVKAGAIPIAATNTPELCMNYETFNNTTGRTVNPYDSRRTCGGSSGGEAALLCAGASLIGLGSDIGGSLRLPAHFCGVWGHKPTTGATSIEGHFPESAERENWTDVFSLGPMSRYAVDLPILFEVITKEEKKNDLILYKKVNLPEIQIFYFEEKLSLLNHSTDKDIRKAIVKVLHHFNTKHNTQVQKFSSRDFQKLLPLSLFLLMAFDDVNDIFGNDADKSAWLELWRWFMRKSDFSLMSIIYVLFNRLKPRNLKDYRKHIPKLRKSVEDLLGENGVLICPTFPTVASFHNQVIGKVYNNVYLTVFNALGFPVTNCPVGFNHEGLPVGIQVAASRNCDRLTLAVALEIERAFGGWNRSPFNVKPVV